MEIRGGKKLRTFTGETPIEFQWVDKDGWAGKTYYRLDVQGGKAGRLLSNPVFAMKGLQPGAKK